MRQPSEIIINGKTLTTILEEHKKWLTNEGGERADLSFADLSHVDLSHANLRFADFNSANLSCANLRFADFNSANLSYVDLRHADLNSANLSYVDLRYATLDGKERLRKGVILSTPIKGFKKTQEGVILEAEIPAGAIVFSINNKKCRTNKARIVNTEGKVLHSQYDDSFTYTEGQEIEIDNFDLMYNVECASGFHFFKTRKEAEEY